MSQRTLISFHHKRQKKNKDRISSLLSGGSKKRTSASTPVTAEATESTSTETTRSQLFGGETEKEVRNLQKEMSDIRKKMKSNKLWDEMYDLTFVNVSNLFISL